jgi:hypothetical protein
MTKDAAAEKYRKKPVVIEAFHYTGMGDAFGLGEWAQQRGIFYWDDNNVLHVKTLEGEHIASEGDWIIKGVQGEFYPCKPDVFEKTYERASLQEAEPTGEVELQAREKESSFLNEKINEKEAELQQAREEIERLTQWKKEAVAVMPDFQEIGKLLNIPLGTSVSEQIIPKIKELKEAHENNS